MPHQVRKAVIPVAGFGTRFLPATKAQPKEMLPIVDKPILQYIVEEAVASGIEDIIIVTNLNKRAAEDHFDHLPELEAWLQKQGKDRALAEVKKVAELANFIYLRQKGPYGNGTPILNAKHVIGDEPFAVIWGDDLMVSERPRLKQLIEVYEQYGSAVLTAYEVDDEGTKHYGILDAKAVKDNVYQVNSIVEKPGPQKAPSHLASLGGYVLTPDIFTELEQTPLGRDHELWLVDALEKLRQKQTLYACKISGTYYDVGSKLGWLKANIDFGLKHPELGAPLKQYLDSLT
ncbi:MAG: UTP--glucose-1-phosphate uridylyltransferase GalU [Candidatus Kerfeldbacteria bacterium]|nr:UTP--glucose-1-phosphate uridylyltransferase GalU [Candidatus Kerfeldbacteria bacterium]